MATQRFYDWVARGRPFELCRPVRELAQAARNEGVSVLGTIGNEDHLTANRPEDHTPFSYTAWPLPLPGWIVTAADIREGSFADRFIAETKRGLHRWVKYLNLRGKHYDFKAEDWENPIVTSSGDIHLHVSARTDRLNYPLTQLPAQPSIVEDEIMLLAQVVGSPTVWVGNGVHRRAVMRETSVRALIARGADATHCSSYYGGEAQILSVDELTDFLGIDVEN